ncbi:uncharacterized protein CLUP02_09465 [Colletotrichum lupini]|uniref:Uncharacterized protein n=1 Tax=Colletotrichum lupini TaxID=145971 RepID=A0A9Q8SUR1_9PEZI|nr:uncharacterized protein CLUP02_09465 [Colletotrichum lupini]UQC83969.1 hypothetical protein CLUP02_09465 [Colletotrichum lupini]
MPSRKKSCSPILLFPVADFPFQVRRSARNGTTGISQHNHPHCTLPLTLTLILILTPHTSRLISTAYSLILVNDLLSRQCTCHDAVRTELQLGRRPPKNTAPMPNVLYSPCQAIILNPARLASSAIPRSRANILQKMPLKSLPSKSSLVHPPHNLHLGPSKPSFCAWLGATFLAAACDYESAHMLIQVVCTTDYDMTYRCEAIIIFTHSISNFITYYRATYPNDFTLTAAVYMAHRLLSLEHLDTAVKRLASRAINAVSTLASGCPSKVYQSYEYVCKLKPDDPHFLSLHFDSNFQLILVKERRLDQSLCVSILDIEQQLARSDVPEITAVRSSTGVRKPSLVPNNSSFPLNSSVIGGRYDLVRLEAAFRVHIPTIFPSKQRVTQGKLPVPAPSLKLNMCRQNHVQCTTPAPRLRRRSPSHRSPRRPTTHRSRRLAPPSPTFLHESRSRQ